MSILLKLGTIIRLLKWKRNAGKFDLDRLPGISNPKFMSARQAASLIPDGAVAMSTGMTATMRPAILYRAVRAVYEQTGHPKGITWIAAGGAGGRGVVPGTVEEVGLDGLVTRFISGHLETARAQLALGEAGKCELGVLPQGTILFLADAQGHGEDSIVSEVGVGSFMDPRVGSGSQVIPGVGEQFVTAEDEHHLRYRMPKVTVGVGIATAADADGNIYMTGASMQGETREACRAARANGGVAIVTVAQVIPRNDAEIFLRADEVDAIVVNPTNEMSLAVPQLDPWPELTPGKRGDVRAAAIKVKAINDILKLDPPRGPIEHLLARHTASIFARNGHPGVRCIIGYGLPQEVGRLVEHGGLAHDVTFLIETGIHGGVPVTGIYFGMAFHPDKLVTSAEMFRYCEQNLDITILGTLQVDELGNVNVSKKAEGAKNYIGPGGFLNLVACAKTIIFTGAFMARSKIEIQDGKVRLVEPGIAKYVERVDEITFCAKAALEAGKKVFYVTPIAAFRLTEQGMELFQVAPGIDIDKDILANSRAKIHLPEDGKVDVLDASIVTGKDFKLAWTKRDNSL